MPLPWLRPEHDAIARAFEPGDLAPLLRAAGIDRTVLVQAIGSDADTDYMFEHAARHDWIGAVVAWAELESPPRAAARLEELSAQPKLRGIRHQIHDEEDAHWILRRPVLESIALVEQRGLVLEICAVWPRHLGDVPALAERFPGLTIVIDHLGKPPLDGDLAPWGEALGRAAAHPRVAAKISGLNTATSRPDWRARDLQPALETALECFGSERLLWGSDWPVSLLNGDYERVWAESRLAVETIAPDALDAVFGENAVRLYRLAD